ncbi:MAG: type II secretion system protein N [Pseudomonadota bacterium]
MLTALAGQTRAKLAGARLTGASLAQAAISLATLIAVAFLSIAAARLVWTLIAGPGAHVRIAPAMAQTGSAPTNLDYSILSRITPFRSGQAASPGAIDTAAPAGDFGFADVEETTLDLKLHGLISENDDGGHAFISTNSGVQTAYAIGDEIDGAQGVTLERILTDSVLLRRNGNLESLAYATGDAAITTLSAVDTLDPEAVEDAGEPDTAPTRAIAPVGEDGAPIAPDTAPPSAGSAPGQEETPQAQGNDTDRPTLPTIIRRLTRADLETLALSIRLEENRSTDAGGLFVFPTGNISVFAKSGLEAGDIITDVAGLKLDSRADFDRLLQEVEEQRQINLVIVRGQDTRDLRVTIID